MYRLKLLIYFHHGERLMYSASASHVRRFLQAKLSDRWVISVDSSFHGETLNPKLRNIKLLVFRVHLHLDPTPTRLLSAIVSSTTSALLCSDRVCFLADHHRNSPTPGFTLRVRILDEIGIMK
ncbi:hypothetical protein KC19_2G145200 [Ceratodon purpureus]|uniref:Uncharacterized protein n=1 Tax=Ceratodon purpureus TaxID=3225 RepID=A0A8T0IWS9_CERPU|nr:hypothetical protein KC19_2G145200 [Ceratodon purpureus]